MKQLIDKSTLVAEIDSLQDATMDENRNFLSSYHEGIFDGLSRVETFIDSLEMKDVDIEKEVANWWNEYYGCIKKNYTFEGYTGHYMENSTIISLAKHFFEMGLKTQKEE